MSKFTDKLAKYNLGLKYYMVVPATKVIGEDGKYMVGDNAGYGIVNKETDVIEHTNTCLAAAMFQANHFDDMLSSMLDEIPALSLVDTAAEDIMPSEPH